ncbi:hypothetical protein RND81_01G028900 [Saponaria officinalis]|uniref:HhH-GPD domain-containing protein n=5 Tax=Saponaria officinalis TaxID=3572 RepID=A0AAW1NDN8_SAPOF
MMETQRTEGSWTPETPVKPNVGRRNPIYDDGQGALLAQAWGEREASLSKFNNNNINIDINNNTPQNNNININDIWDGGHGTTQLRRENVEIERQGLEGYLPHWSSQGRKSVMSYGSSDHGSVSYPVYDAWDSVSSWKNNGSILERDFGDADFSTMSFGDLLNINESLTLRNNGSTASNGMLLPSWGSRPQDSGLLLGNQGGTSQQINGLYSQGTLNDAFTGPFWSASDPKLLPSDKHASGSSVFAPATPDSWQRLQRHLASENAPPCSNERLNEQNMFPDHAVAAKMIEIQDGQNEKVSGPITDSLPGKVSTVEEDNSLDKGNQAIDLNNTPQKKPRRRRYQPKVIRENKPKRTPKPKTPKPTETQGKRKYARKNKTNTPTAKPPEEGTEPKPSEQKPTEPEPKETPVKSCKKSLNFDLNGQATEQSSNVGFDAEPQTSECQEAGNESVGKMSISAYDLNLTQNQELREYISLPVMENVDNSQMNNNILMEDGVKSPECLSEKKAESSTRKDCGSAQSPNSSPCASSSEVAQTRGLKRSVSYAAETFVDVEIATTEYTPWVPNNISPRVTPTELPGQSFTLKSCKRKRTEKAQTSYVQSTSSVAASEDTSQGGKDQGHPQVELTASKYYCYNSTVGISEVSNNYAMLVERSENRYQLMKTWADLSRLNKKKRTKGATRVRDLAPLSGIAAEAEGARKKKVDSESGSHPCHEASSGVLCCTEGLASETKTTPKSNRRSKKQDDVNSNWNIVPYNPPAKEATGSVEAPPLRKRRYSILQLTQRFRKLDINRGKRKNSRKQNRSIVPYRGNKQEQNALVLYDKDGSMVPYEGPFNPINKRRQRARVDLDDETTRVWRLLLENIDNEGVNGTDEEKAKWWENERSVFQGRVDSFIARMRLVQGDRRFTPWKGSVLDSVIGVFLTQNVSDHLSSSAFMSMAARFPLKTETSGSTVSEEATSGLFGETEIIEPEERITWNEKIVDQPTLDKNSRAIFYFDHSEDKEVVNSRERSEKKAGPVRPTQYFSETYQKVSSYARGYDANSQTTETETVYHQGEDKARDDASSSQQSVISSQNSINSSNQQTVAIMSTFSESYARTQAVTSSSKFDCLDHTASFMGLLKMAEGNMHHQFNSQAQVQGHLEHMKHVTEYYPGVSSSNYPLNLEAGFHVQDTQGLDMLEVESRTSDMSRKDENSPPTEQSNLTSEIQDQEKSPDSFHRAAQNMSCYILEGDTMVVHSQMKEVKKPLDTIASSSRAEASPNCKNINVPILPQEMGDVIESTRTFEKARNNSKEDEKIHGHNYTSGVVSDMADSNPATAGKGKAEKGKKNGFDWDSLRRDATAGKGKKNEFDWDSLRRDVQVDGKKPERPAHTRDSLDWEAVRHAKASDIAETIKERGMNNVLAGRIKDLLDRLVKDHGSTDMEWLRDIPPDKAKEYLLSFRGLGLKSVECVRLLTLHHMAFPVDTNVGRIAVRLGWVPLQPLPESLQLHLLELYPILESIQQYLWPRLCKLDQKTLYELHYHMITFGKVFCTKRQPNCNACPLRGECRHFASAFASARFALPGPEEKSIVPASGNTTPPVNPRVDSNLLPSTASWDSHIPHSNSASWNNHNPHSNSASWNSHNPHSNSESYASAIVQGPSFPLSLSVPETVHLERKSINSICEPIIEVPASPEQEPQNDQALCDIEDAFYEDPNEIPTINLNMKEFTETLQNFMLQETGMSNALVALTAEAASIPTPKLKNINRLRTEHHVYELPDTHPLLQGLEKREPDDPCSYLLAIWTPGETADSIDPPARRCSFDDPNMLCNEETCCYCSSQREADSQIVRGTLLIPTRTAMRGSFPLNGTYFQVNEVFADHDSSLNPIAVPRSWLWNLPRRTVYFGTSIPTIFKGLNTEDIQHCFWRGYVCVRGFDQKTRAPRPLMARLHFPASRIQRGAKGKVYDE